MINKWIINIGCLIAIICIFTLPVLTMEDSDSSTDSSNNSSDQYTEVLGYVMGELKKIDQNLNQLFILANMTHEQTNANAQVLNYLVNLNNKLPQTLEERLSKPNKTVITRFKEKAKKQSQKKLALQNSETQQ